MRLPRKEGWRTRAFVATYGPPDSIAFAVLSAHDSLTSATSLAALACWSGGGFAHRALSVGVRRGSHRSLPRMEPCGQAHSERACSNPCGEGGQVCQVGFWQPCVVAVVTSSCADACGSGAMYTNPKLAKCSWTITPRNSASPAAIPTSQLHLFFAERHVINSDFSVETTIADPGTCQ
jgi:hypothetical protein